VARGRSRFLPKQYDPAFPSEVDGYVSSARAVLRIAPIAADPRFGAVWVKGRACSIACDAAGTLDACRVGPHLSMIASGAMRKPTARRERASTAGSG
jgi:hypothetical protein